MDQPRARPSRFIDARHEVRSPESDERVSRDERQRRQVAWALRETFTPKAKRQAFAEKNGLHDDSDPAVRTDVVGAVEVQAEGWVAVWTLAEHQGVTVARSLHLEPTGQATPAGGITSNLLRELSPAAVVSTFGAHLDGVDEDDDEDNLNAVFLRLAQADREDFGPTAPTAPTRGRPPLHDAEIAKAAVAYLEELKRGKGVTRRLAERLGVPEDTARDRVRMARRRGFLSNDAKQGRRGGAPGPRLRELLEQAEQSRQTNDDDDRSSDQ